MYHIFEAYQHECTWESDTYMFLLEYVWRIVAMCFATVMYKTTMESMRYRIIKIHILGSTMEVEIYTRRQLCSELQNVKDEEYNVQLNTVK